MNMFYTFCLNNKKKKWMNEKYGLDEMRALICG